MTLDNVNKKTISDYSIFGEYKNPEDRLTAALLQVMHYGGHELIACLFDSILDLPSNEAIIIPQSTQKASRPDGEIRLNCQYQIFIESKIVPNAIKKEQLEKHSQLANPSNGKYLVYLTPDKNKPQKIEFMNGLVEWMSWDNVYDILSKYKDIISDEVLRFLIDQLLLLIMNIVKKVAKKVVRNSKTTIENDKIDNLVIIVGGNWGENIAKKYNFYACQPNRFFYNAQFIAFYHQNRIKELFKIIDDPIESIDIQTHPRISKEYFKIEEPHYVPQQRKLFLLEHIHTFNPEIINDKKDKNGHNCAFIQRQTYTSYEKIMKATKTSQL